MAEDLTLDTIDDDLADEALDRNGGTISTIGGTHACH